jgi:copper(I)-binding protein
VIRSSRGGLLPRSILIAAAAALVPLAAGCEAGANAPTQQWHQPTDGTDATVGDIMISNAFVLGAPLNSSLLPGQTAGLYLALVNIGTPDRLLSVTAPGTATTVQLPRGLVILPSQRAILLTGPRPAVLLEQLTRALPGGTTVKIVLTFQNAGTKTLFVPVMPQAQYYTTYSPAPSPTPTVSFTLNGAPSPSGTTGRHHKKGQKTPSPSPSGSP